MHDNIRKAKLPLTLVQMQLLDPLSHYYVTELSSPSDLGPNCVMTRVQME